MYIHLCINIYYTHIFMLKSRVCVLVTQSWTLCESMDCSPPGSSVHGILQAGTVEWVAMPFSRGSSRARACTQVSCNVDRFFIVWALREPHVKILGESNLEPFITVRVDMPLDTAAVHIQSYPIEVTDSPEKMRLCRALSFCLQRWKIRKTLSS